MQLIEKAIAEIINKKLSDEKLEKYLASIIGLLDAIENNNDFLVTPKDSLYRTCRLLSLVIKNHSLSNLKTDPVKAELAASVSLQNETSKAEKGKTDLVVTEPIKSDQGEVELVESEPITTNSSAKEKIKGSP